MSSEAKSLAGEPGEASEQVHLVVHISDHRCERVPLTRFPVTIGSDSRCDIVLRHNQVAPEHLVIKKRDRCYIVEALATDKGTYVNGDRIVNAILQSGDSLLVGIVKLSFVNQDQDVSMATQIGQYNMLTETEAGEKATAQSAELAFNPSDAVHEIDLTALTSLRSPKQNLILEMLQNIHTITDAEETSKTILKCIGQMLPDASRAALFMQKSGDKKLRPLGTRYYSSRASFVLSQTAFKSVLQKTTGMVISGKPQPTAQGATRVRAVLPIVSAGVAIGAAHIEFDQTNQELVPARLEPVQALLNLSAGHLESRLLRQEMDDWLMDSVAVIIASVEAKDTYTRGHSERVSRYSLAMADELKLNQEVKRYLLVSSLCHDIGKIGVADSVLKKPSMLSHDEYEEIKQHPSLGADIIKHLPSAQKILSGVKYHHEKWDGTGYPDGLEGEEIPFFARIIAIADAFDAMISGRSYSGFMQPHDAMDRLIEIRDLFDPVILDAFIKAYEKGAMTQRTNTVIQ